MTDVPADFAGVLGALIGEAGHTQEDLAVRAGVGLSTVSELIRGIHHTCHRTTAERLAAALVLEGYPRDIFVAVARGRLPAARLAEDSLWDALTRQTRYRGQQPPFAA
jgi:transcriptional regulator with XRE-family HTH domain